MRKVKYPFTLAIGLAFLLTGGLLHAQQSADADAAAQLREERAALRLISSAEDLLADGETDRALRVLDTALERFADSPARFRAHLVLGRYYVEQDQYGDALAHLRNVLILDNPERTLTDDQRAWLQEALYLVGRSYYETRQYSSAFPTLRKLIRDYPNSIWANQAHYYIGLAHFSQGNWQRAIDSLALVGTFIEPDSPATSTIEMGRRFYIKVVDEDLTVATRLGRPVRLRLSTRYGDEEVVDAIPLTTRGETYIASIPTRVGPAVKGNSTLELLSGDRVTVTYVDENTRDGQSNVKRVATVDAVSTGTLEFTQGTFDAPAVAAFVDQPLFVVLRDADLDKSNARETVDIVVQSRYELPPDETIPTNDPRANQPRWETRDETTITLTETGARTGVFTGQFPIREAGTNGVGLQAEVGDQILGFYTDVLHADGTTPREVTARLTVSGSIEGKPRATQFVVTDAIIKARKNLVEAAAFLELGRIFQSMGLKDGAAQRCDRGLELVEQVLRMQDLPTRLTEEAFRLKWELEITKEDYRAAVATCTLFSRLYPESPLVDQALMGIARVMLADEDYLGAIGILNRIIALPNAQSKAEAQFMIAEATEKQNPERPELAIPFYRLTAERYPTSEFAGPAISKLVDYYIESRDYAQAQVMLEQVFMDHPDAQFLDSMLMKWIVLAFRMQDYATAREKCAQLLFDYPDSRFVARVQQILPHIEARLQSQ